MVTLKLPQPNTVNKKHSTCSRLQMAL